MKTIQTYCHLVLAAIFIATLIPFHAFHEHMEIVHHVASASKNTEDHHCKLDENYCQDSSLKHCDHKQHVAESGEKCFVSKYHFIKNITLAANPCSFMEFFKAHYFEQIIINKQIQFVLLLNNKGPPQSFFS
ncbi:MAG: hypothetical protein V4620_13760 [Bacteroidota bacterium]